MGKGGDIKKVSWRKINILSKIIQRKRMNMEDIELLRYRIEYWRTTIGIHFLLKS